MTQRQVRDVIVFAVALITGIPALFIAFACTIVFVGNWPDAMVRAELVPLTVLFTAISILAIWSLQEES